MSNKWSLICGVESGNCGGGVQPGNAFFINNSILGTEDVDSNVTFVYKTPHNRQVMTSVEY